MHTHLIALSFAAAATTALAAQPLPRGQRLPPGLSKPFHEIAFVRVSSSLDAPVYADPTDLQPASERKNAIFLIRPDGSDEAKLYSSNTPITFVDLKPGGGEIAFIEGTNVKRLKFNKSGVVVGDPTSLVPLGGWGDPVCSPVSVDYHPTNSWLMVAAACGTEGIFSGEDRLIVYNANGSIGGQKPVMKGITSARWLTNGNYLYVRNTQAGDQGPPGGSRLRVRMSQSGGPWWSAPTVADVDTASWMSPNTLIDTARTVPNGTVVNSRAQGRWVIRRGDWYSSDGAQFRGSGGHFSPDDQKVLFEANCTHFDCGGSSRRGQGLVLGSVLAVGNSDGTSTKLTAVGLYGATDWRN